MMVNPLPPHQPAALISGLPLGRWCFARWCSGLLRLTRRRLRRKSRAEPARERPNRVRPRHPRQITSSLRPVHHCSHRLEQNQSLHKLDTDVRRRCLRRQRLFLHILDRFSQLTLHFLRASARLIAPEVLEPIRRQLSVAHSVLDVLVAEPCLQRSRVVAGSALSFLFAFVWAATIAWIVWHLITNLV